MSGWRDAVGRWQPRGYQSTGLHWRCQRCCHRQRAASDLSATDLKTGENTQKKSLYWPFMDWATTTKLVTLDSHVRFLKPFPGSRDNIKDWYCLVAAKTSMPQMAHHQSFTCSTTLITYTNPSTGYRRAVAGYDGQVINQWVEDQTKSSQHCLCQRGVYWRVYWRACNPNSKWDTDEMERGSSLKGENFEYCSGTAHY